MKKTAKYERFFAKDFDKRFPLGWWRYVDPYAGFSRLLDLGQRVTDALGLGMAWDFYDARIRLRSNFEKLVQDAAQLELRRGIINRLDFYKERGYDIKGGLGDIVMRDLINALGADRTLEAQMKNLQRLP